MAKKLTIKLLQNALITLTKESRKCIHCKHVLRRGRITNQQRKETMKEESEATTGTENVIPFNQNPEPQCKSDDRPITEKQITDCFVVENKQFRKELDEVLQRMKSSSRKSRNRSLAITHLEDSIMRLGMDLKDLNEPTPYPNSYNPGNTIVDKTADGLKL